VLCTKMSDSAMTPFDNAGSNKYAQLSANSSPISEDPTMLDMASGAMSSVGMGMDENPLKPYIKPPDYETDSETEDEKDKVRQTAETECMQELGVKLTNSCHERCSRVIK
jgi:hypothetical protein